MTPEWYDIAWINFKKAILHGHRADDSEIERVLTKEERWQVEELNERHADEMKALLRSLAGEAA